MNPYSHKDYDLTIGNVEKWRQNGYWSAESVARRSRMLRISNNAPAHKPRRNFELYPFLCVWSERLFMALVCAAGVGVVWIVASFVSALLSGRIAAIVESIKAAH